MNPADLTLPSTSPSLSSKLLPSTSLAPKNGKVPVARLELEPIYAQLRTVLGEQWTDYKTAINAFVLGNLNQAELNWVIHPLVSSHSPLQTIADNAKTLATSVAALHNALLSGLYANILRDPPPLDVATWVAETDQPSTTPKTAPASGVNDQAEERLKRETMAIHARDRRRIKTLKEKATPVNDGFREVLDYAQSLAVRAPALDGSTSSTSGPGAGGLPKNNYDLEMRRRYAHSLAAETLEFPTQSEVQSRIEPICSEEGLLAGTQATLQSCAELVEQATEVFLKEMLGHLCSHSRADGDEGWVHTARFRKRLRREEAACERGTVARNPMGLLPVEVDAQAKRGPMTMDDLRLALELGDPFLRRNPFLSESLRLNQYPVFDVQDAIKAVTQLKPPMTNGVGASATTGDAVAGALNNSNNHQASHLDDDADADADADPDEFDYWRGAADHDRDELMNVLDDCLAVG